MLGVPEAMASKHRVPGTEKKARPGSASSNAPSGSTLLAITLSTALHSDCGHMTSGQVPENGGFSGTPGKLSSSKLAWRAKLGQVWTTRSDCCGLGAAFLGGGLLAAAVGSCCRAAERVTGIALLGEDPR